jgi:hypothetical protein
MERVALLLPFRPFGRFRHLRNPQRCAAAPIRPAGSPVTDLPGSEHEPRSLKNLLPSLLPAYSRLSSRLASILPPVSPSGSFSRAASSLAGRPAVRPTALSAGAGTTSGVTAAVRAVRVYRGPSRLIMVGNINEVCRMIDRCIADESAGLGGLFD